MKPVTAEALRGLLKDKPILFVDPAALSRVGLVYVDEIVHRSPNLISSKGHRRFPLEIWHLILEFGYSECAFSEGSISSDESDSSEESNFSEESISSEESCSSEEIENSFAPCLLQPQDILRTRQNRPEALICKVVTISEESTFSNVTDGRTYNMYQWYLAHSEEPFSNPYGLPADPFCRGTPLMFLFPSYPFEVPGGTFMFHRDIELIEIPTSSILDTATNKSVFYELEVPDIIANFEDGNCGICGGVRALWWESANEDAHAEHMEDLDLSLQQRLRHVGRLSPDHPCQLLQRFIKLFSVDRNWRFPVLCPLCMGVRWSQESVARGYILRDSEDGEAIGEFFAWLKTRYDDMGYHFHEFVFLTELSFYNV